MERPANLKFVTAYNYPDAAGTLRFQVVRYDPKSFKQRRPDGAGGWIWNLDGVERVLYNLPALLKAGDVFVVEGEKDADLLASWNLAATCNSGASGKWLSSYATPPQGKAVVILPDADAPGRRHALTVANSLLGVATEVRIVELLGAKDVTAWADKDGSRNTLMRLAGEAEPLDQRSLEGLRARWFPSDGAPERPRRLASLDALPDLWEVRAPAQPEVVKGLLGAGEVTLLAGKPGSGKSYVALGLAMAVATGKPFCGRQTTQLRVLILDKENPLQIIRQRVDHLGGRAIPSEDLCFWGGWREFAPEIGSPLVAEFAKVGGLIIVDSATRFFEGKSENDSAEIARFFRPMIRLARMGGTLLVICHSGKGATAQDYRGSSDYAAAADASFKLDRDGPLGEPLTTFALKITKSRSGSARAPQGRLPRFQQHYDPIAKPFQWKFTRRDLAKLLKQTKTQPDDSTSLAASLKVIRDRIYETMYLGTIIPCKIARQTRYASRSMPEGLMHPCGCCGVDFCRVPRSMLRREGGSVGSVHKRMLHEQVGAPRAGCPR